MVVSQLGSYREIGRAEFLLPPIIAPILTIDGVSSCGYRIPWWNFTLVGGGRTAHVGSNGDWHCARFMRFAVVVVVDFSTE